MVWDVGNEDVILVGKVDVSSENKDGTTVPIVLSDWIPILVNGFAVLLWTATVLAVVYVTSAVG